jgi:hypothetical protein
MLTAFGEHSAVYGSTFDIHNSAVIMANGFNYDSRGFRKLTSKVIKKFVYFSCFVA